LLIIIRAMHPSHNAIHARHHGERVRRLDSVLWTAAVE